MAGSSGISEYPIPFTSAPNAVAQTVTAANAIGITANDVALLTDVTTGTAPTRHACWSRLPRAFTYTALAPRMIPLGAYLSDHQRQTPKALSSLSQKRRTILNLGQAPMMQVFGRRQ